MKYFAFLLILVATFASSRLGAQIPPLINYQGRVAVDAVNFEGGGQFKFALVNSDGTTTFWSNDGTSDAGSEPAAAVTLNVQKGLYSVLLGDIALANMTALPPSAFANADVRLRVWFDDGLNGSQLLTPDQRLAPAVYLADGTVTTEKIAQGAVTGSAIAPGSIEGANIAPASLDFSHLTVPAAPTAGQVLSFDGATLNWTAPGVGDGIWTLDGTFAYRVGNVAIGTATPNPGFRLAVNGEVQFTPGGPGGTMQWGTPNGETGMTWGNPSTRADLRFDGSTVKLLAGPAGGPPGNGNGIAVKTDGYVGIGTVNPESKLQVRTNAASYGITHSDGNVVVGSFTNSSGGWLGTKTDHPLHLFVNNGQPNGQPSLTIDSFGRIGIGVTNPTYNLDIKGSVRTQGYAVVDGSLNVQLSAFEGFGVELEGFGYFFQVYPNRLDLHGNAFKSEGGTAWAVLSDERLKQDIRAFKPGLNEVLRLRPVRFRYREGIKRGLTSTHEEVGFIAQEVQPVIPEAVTEEKEGYLTLKADPIHWASVNAIKELNAKLEQEQSENAELKRRLTDMETRLDQLARRLK